MWDGVAQLETLPKAADTHHETERAGEREWQPRPEQRVLLPSHILQAIQHDDERAAVVASVRVQCGLEQV
jgi:hypothetical protein